MRNPELFNGYFNLNSYMASMFRDLMDRDVYEGRYFPIGSLSNHDDDRVDDDRK